MCCTSSNPSIHQCPVLLSTSLDLNVGCGKLKAKWLDRFGIKIIIGITVKENSSKKANQKKQKPTQWSKQTLRKTEMVKSTFSLSRSIPENSRFCVSNLCQNRFCGSYQTLHFRRANTTTQTASNATEVQEVIDNSGHSGRPSLQSSSTW